MLEGKVFTLVIGKDMVEKENILDVVRAISKMEDNGVDAFERIAVSFHGYDDSSVEIWETPEIRKWCHKLINKIPHLFYYIENDYFQTQQTLMLCMNDYDSVYIGERKSPVQHTEDGLEVDEFPQHKVVIHVHQKSMRLMFSEIRKHARKLGKMKNAEKVIAEMSERYGVSTD